MRGLRLIAMLTFAAAAVWFSVGRSPSAVLAAGNTLAISLDVQNTGPRSVEDATQKAVERDYAAAWQAMTQALDQNRPDLLDANFIGTASDKLNETIQQQKKAGLHRRYTDLGHKVQAIFYSTEGSAMELHDAARLRIELLDGDKIVSSEDVTVHYVTLMTAAENSWKVRLLEEIPSL
jgi:hypothetical protein